VRKKKDTFLKDGQFSFLASNPFAGYNFLPPALKKIKNQAEGWHVPIVHDQLGLFLNFFLSLFQPKRILEIGGGIGYSTHWMAMAVPQAEFVVIDSNQDRCQKLKENFSQFSSPVSLVVHSGRAQEILPQLQQKFDFIFLDSTKKEYAELLPFLEKILVQKGWLVADNIGFQGRIQMDLSLVPVRFHLGVKNLRIFLEALGHSENWKSYFFSLADGIAVAQKIGG